VRVYIFEELNFIALAGDTFIIAKVPFAFVSAQYGLLRSGLWASPHCSCNH
jgi:hypothetical protein